MADSVEDDLRAQMRDAFAGADYPVDNQMDLLPALPNGPSTTFEAGDVRLTVMELATKYSGHADFPYEDADSLVDDVIAGLKAEDVL